MTKSNFALIGHPVGHSVSPFLHSRLFALKGTEATYDLIDVAPDELAARMPQLIEKYDGFNVTIPHKQAVIPLLGSVEGIAAMCQAVNTVDCTSPSRGFNTDALGFERALEGRGISLSGRVCILGAGGVARAIAYMAAMRGCEIIVCAREGWLYEAENLCAQLRSALPEVKASYHLIEKADEITDIDLLINATPVGMYPHTDACPVGEDIIARSGAVFDAIYNPRCTRLLAIAQQHGIANCDGLSMLVYQAALAQEVWLGVSFTHEELEQVCAETAQYIASTF